MDQPVLIIMAAGLGSRFGGSKQTTSVDDHGQFIIDYSLYDAWRAGFHKVLFVIKEEHKDVFDTTIGRRAKKYLEVEYVFQKPEDIPEGYAVPEGRVKPWGTGHAVRSCRHAVNGPFAVCNADDFYGPSGFKHIYDFLAEDLPESENAMIGYRLRNTVTEFGPSARGICQTENGYLTSIRERLHVVKTGDDAVDTEPDGTEVFLPGDTPTSMNLWGFRRSMMDAFDRYFEGFMANTVPGNPLKAEYLLPDIPNNEMKAGRARIRVIPCEENWFGLTYREDLPKVQEAIRSMKEQGIYPEEF